MPKFIPGEETVEKPSLKAFFQGRKPRFKVGLKFIADLGIRVELNKELQDRKVKQILRTNPVKSRCDREDNDN